MRTRRANSIRQIPWLGNWMPLGYRNRRKGWVAERNAAEFCNPKGIVSHSPGLRGTSYPGSIPREFSTPTGLRHDPPAKPQPRWGCWLASMFPRVAPSSQPWALGRNPFGIQRWNTRKALALATLMPFVADIGRLLWFGLILTVQLGAVAATNDLEEGRKHWAFQAVTFPDPPRVKLA